MVNILAISGSLRRASSNSALLRATMALAPSDVNVTLYGGLGDLPLFNPDLEGNEPYSVLQFRDQLRAADGVLIASPEYAHGVTGVLKNALDWVVGSGEFEKKPVALINVFASSIYAPDALKEIITVMGGIVVQAASQTVALPTNKIDEAGILATPSVSGLLQKILSEFVHGIEAIRADLAANS